MYRRNWHSVEAVDAQGDYMDYVMPMHSEHYVWKSVGMDARDSLS
jgi:hypothetical protein